MKKIVFILGFLFLLGHEAYAGDSPLDLYQINCCEIMVDQKDIDRSEELQCSCSLYPEVLYYEYVRTQALTWAIQKREAAAQLIKSCPEEAMRLITDARYLEFNWRYIEGCDFSPLDPCGEDAHLKKHEQPYCG